MKFKTDVNGTGNILNLDGDRASRSEIRILGNKNEVAFKSNSSANLLLINIRGHNNYVFVGSNCKVRGHILVKGNNHLVMIGDNTTFTDVYLLAQEGCHIVIGRSCMFSRGIEIRTTDAHSVIERTTGLRLNKPGSVLIGNHVWIAANVLVSKGVTIADDCIVAAGSSVFKSIDESHTISAGTPAVVIRQGITWNRDRKAQFSEEEMFSWMKDIPSEEEELSWMKDIPDQIENAHSNDDREETRASDDREEKRDTDPLGDQTYTSE